MEHKEQRPPGYYHILVNRYDHNTDSYTPEWLVGYWHERSFYNWQGFQSEERFSEMCKEIPLSDQHEVVIEIDENRIERVPTISGNDIIIALGNQHRIKGSDLIP